MADLNEVRLKGRLARDPELHTTPSGLTVANLAVATTREWVVNGERREATDFHVVVCWDRLATRVSDLHKGSPVAVVGRLSTRSWEDTTVGGKRYRTDVIASSVEPLELRTSQSTVPA
jgi:single-strand DNA-binding protein